MFAKTSFGKAGLEYLKKRGLTDETIEKFRLGFAPDGWDRLYKAFRERGIEESILLELNLIRKNDKGQAYDSFEIALCFLLWMVKGVS